MTNPFFTEEDFRECSKYCIDGLHLKCLSRTEHECSALIANSKVAKLIEERDRLKSLVREAAEKNLVHCTCEENNEETRYDACAGYKWLEKAKELLK